MSGVSDRVGFDAEAIHHINGSKRLSGMIDEEPALQQLQSDARSN